MATARAVRASRTGLTVTLCRISATNDTRPPFRAREASAGNRPQPSHCP
jgi:hypothetical protein